MEKTAKQNSSVIWLTGLPAAGKTTLALALRDHLIQLGKPCEHLDGDELRKAFSENGFSKEARNIQVRRVAFVAALLERNGITVIVSLISPYRESRDYARSILKNFVEVYVSTPLPTCEQRDPKGLYRRARTGEISGVTGIDDPYEKPLAPEFEINTADREVADCVREIVAGLP